MALATWLFRKYSARAYRRMRERLSDVTATLAEDLAGARVVQAFRRERVNAEYLRRDQRHLPARQPAHRPAQRLVLPVRRPAQRGLDRDRARLRRHALLRGRDHGRHAVRLHALPGELLRPDPGALAALQHVPGGQRGARQDLRRDGHRSPSCTTGRAREVLPPIEGAVELSDRALRLRPGRRGAARHRPQRRRRPDGRARRPHGRRQVDARQAAGALLRPRPRASIRIDGHDLRDIQVRSLREQLGIVPQEALPVRRVDPRQHRLRPPRGDARRGSRRRARSRRRHVHRGAARAATRRRSPSAAPRSRSASAS